MSIYKPTPATVVNAKELVHPTSNTAPLVPAKIVKRTLYGVRRGALMAKPIATIVGLATIPVLPTVTV